MWLLLEYDKDHHDQTLDACKQVGITCAGVLREDQLASVELSQVDLLLVGAKWKAQTVEHLREGGLSAPVVMVTDLLNDDFRAQAGRMRCVDIVSYPLPTEYVRTWARPPQSEPRIDDATPSTSHSAIEELLRTKPSWSFKRSSGESYTGTWVAPPVELPALRGRILLTYGLRGGIGKSTLTSLIAQYLAKRTATVAVVELDPKGNLHERLQIQSPITVDDWAKMPASMDERMVRQALVKPRAASFSLLPRGAHTRDVEATTVRRLLTQLGAYFDFVLVDASTDDALVSTQVAREMAHRVFYVMTPEWDSFRSFLHGYEELRMQKGDDAVTVVVNRYQRSGEHQKAWRLLQEVDRARLQRIPEDRTVRQQMHKGQALTGGRRVQQCLAHLTHDLIVNTRQMAAKDKRRWFQ